MKKLITVLSLSMVFFPAITFAHPGRTDAYGCHTCHTNCAKWGLADEEYHCHNAKALPQPLPPVTSHSNGVTEPAPQYAKPAVQPVVQTAPKTVTKPAVKTEPKNAIKPVEKVLPKSATTSTPVAEQKPTKATPAKESWWSRFKKWF